MKVSSDDVGLILEGLDRIRRDKCTTDFPTFVARQTRINNLIKEIKREVAP